jgi:uncharacterized protein
MTPTTILTYSGARLDLAAPDPAAICLTDIAHGLAHTIRWRGALGPLTVAQHSVLCAMHYRLAGNPAAQRLALLHDAAEAYLGDVPSPAKRACPHGDLDLLELDIVHAIARRFELDLAQSELVAAVDLDMRAWEVQSYRPRTWGGVDLTATFGAPSRQSMCEDQGWAYFLNEARPWGAGEAEQIFLDISYRTLDIEDPT